jgi:catechol 2,3-dioxygenase-like lactoylglutathione lyase family enzyme
MTQIRRLTGGTRRPGVLGVHSLDRFSMTVPNLEQARHFYQSFGLDVREEGRGLALYAPGLEHRWGILNQGKSKKLRDLSFGAFEDDLPRFRDRLSVLHVQRLAPPPGFESNGLWFRDHNGVLVEIRVAEKSSPNEKSSFTAYSAPAGVQGTSYRRNAPPTRPRRLAHLALYTADVGRAIGFYRDVLGLRLSDSSEGMSPSCTARTAATITWSHSRAPPAPACIIAAGMSAPCRRSGSAPCRWPAKATPPAGGSAVTSWARTTSTMCATLGAAIPNILPTWITSPPITIGSQATIRARTLSSCGGPNPPEDFVRNYEIET